MAVLNNWQEIRDELSDIGDLDPNRAFEPSVLREWFCLAMTCTDQVIRQKVEKALSSLAKKPEAVELVAQLIRTDPDVHVRVFGATYLANNAASFVDSILEGQSPDDKDILSFCLNEEDMPGNVRAVLLKGFSSFMFKVIPDVWSNSLAQVVSSRGNPSFVLEVLANLSRSVSDQPQVFSQRRQRNDYLLNSISSCIVPYLHQVVEQTDDTALIYKVAEVVRYFWALNGAEPDYMWPVVVAIFNSGRTITSLVCGIRSFSPRQFPRCLSEFCLFMLTQVNGPLLEAIDRSVRMASYDEQVDHDGQMLELTAELCDFYGYVVSSTATLAFCRRCDVPNFPSLDTIINMIFEFVVKLTQVPGKPGFENPFTEMSGMFFNRLFEVMSDIIYNVDPNKKKQMCNALEGSVEAIFNKSRLAPTDVGDQVDAVERFRESLQDLIILLDLLSEHSIIPALIQAMNSLLNDKTCDSHLRMASITVFYYYLCCLPEIPYDVVEPHIETFKSTLHEICTSEISDHEKEECVYHFLTFLSGLLEKDENSAGLVREIFLMIVPFLVGFSQYPKALVASLRLIYSYSRYCVLDEGVVSEMCGLVVGFATNPSAEVQELVVCALINFLSCGPVEEATPVCCFVLEFIEKQCANCLAICTSCKVFDPLTLQTFREQSQLISFVGKNANPKALSMVAPLVTILCDYLVRLLECRVPEQDLLSFTNPICKLINKNAIRRLSCVQADYSWNYPDVFVRIYKEGLSLGDDFVVNELIQMISNLVASVFSASGNSQQVSGADLSILELVIFFLRRHQTSFFKFVQAKSSIDPVKDFLTACVGVALKTISYSYSDEGISKGLRALEAVMTIGDEEILDSLSAVFPMIIPPVFDLVFSLFFHIGQGPIALVLVALAKKIPEAFCRYVTQHKEMVHNDEVKFILGTPNRGLFLKYFLRWNSAWNRRKEH